MQNEYKEPNWYVTKLLEQAQKDPAYRNSLNKAVVGGRITMRQINAAASELKRKGVVVGQLVRPGVEDMDEAQRVLWPPDARERP